ncbi:MAG: hypothetical protein ACRC1U_09335, partial [Vibrionaceae bacterium]
MPEDQAAAIPEDRKLFATAMSFNYALAMRLFFSQTAIEQCTDPELKLLMEQINQQTHPYVRLKLLCMAFLCFYSERINQSICRKLFDTSSGTISNWYSEFVKEGDDNSTDGITRIINRTLYEVNTKGQPLSALKRAGPMRYQRNEIASINEAEKVQRSSLASILAPLHARLGLMWDGANPSENQERSLSTNAIMSQLTFDLSGVNQEAGVAAIHQAAPALLRTFNLSNTPSSA